MQYYWKKKTIVSFICAFLVTMIHLKVSIAFDGKVVYYLEHFFSNVLSVMAVPLFFIISGASFFRDYDDEKYWKKLKARAKSLIVPYFAWNILISVLYMILYTTPLQNILGAENRFEFSVQYIFQAVFLHKRILAFWFIYDLIIFVLLTPLISIFLKRKWIAVVFGLVLLSLPLYATDVLGKIGVWATAPIYYFVGCFIGKYCFFTFSGENIRYRWIGVVACVLSIAVLLCSRLHLLYLPILIRQVIVIVFAMSFWLASDYICPKASLKNYMNHNFFIFAAHPFLQAILIKVGAKILPNTELNALVIYCLTAFLTIYIIVKIGDLLKNKLPRAYTLLSGGR